MSTPAQEPQSQNGEGQGAIHSMAQMAAPIIGLASNSLSRVNQKHTQQALTDIQVGAQNRITDFNRQSQLQLWRDTNAAAQAAQYRKAGLNVGLMYEGGGAGGQTNLATGSVTGATAQDKSASAGEIAGMGLMAAQVKLMNAQAEKTTVETAKIAGVDTAKTQIETESLAQGIQNQQAQEALTKADTYLREAQAKVANETMDEAIETIEWGTERAMHEVKVIEAQGKVDQATIDSRIQIVRRTSTKLLLEQALIKSQTDQTKQLTEESKTKVKQMSEQIAQGWEGLSLQERRNQIEQFGKELQAEYPGILNVGGKVVNEILNGAQYIMEKTTGRTARRNHRKMEN